MSRTSNQLLELLVVFFTADGFHYAFFRVKASLALAEFKGGPIKPESMPTKLSILINPIQGLAFAIVPMIYMIAVISNGMQQPVWMNSLALPDVLFSIRVEGAPRNAIRVIAAFASIGLQRLTDAAFEHLGDQFHPIGRRAKPRVIQSGPYGWVRHPIYSLSLLQNALLSLMYWSYAPLISLVTLVIVFAVKIPIEEEAIQRDEVTKEEYLAYMKKVPWKIVPFVW